MSSAASGHLGHAARSRPLPPPRSIHLADSFLEDFRSPSFDPAAFLNARLPPLQGKAPAGSDAVPLTELSGQAQALLTQLNAHTTRLSSTLTQLTDDILRSGSRLAYEVELLRGETLSLTETLHETLHDDIKKFIPEGLPYGPDTARPGPVSAVNGERASIVSPPGKQPELGGEVALRGSPLDPVYIQQLQTLTLVRARLESVIKTFGKAMDFVFPPSKLSVSSSFLSVSAPEPGSQQQSSEDKGQQVLRELRDEIQELLSKTDDAVQGIERATQRIEELKDLTQVWKGTAEEKGRLKFIESLAKMVEERHRELMRDVGQEAKEEGKGDAAVGRKAAGEREAAGADDGRATPAGFGLMNQLQKLRSGL